MIVDLAEGGHICGIVLVCVVSQKGQPMNSTAFDTLTRTSAQGVSRRTSFLAIGSAALAATLATGGSSAAKNKKNGNKGADKKKKRCNKDAAACKDTLQPLCTPENQVECLKLQQCCEECSANGFLECLILNSEA